MSRPHSAFTLCLFACIHFIVDLACIYYLAGILTVLIPNHEHWLLLAVLYNLLAFALPALLGLLADLRGRCILWSSIGCLMIFLGYCFLYIPVAAVFLIGIGNGLFHIGGGIRILKDANGLYTWPGIFIATGAFGVFLGTHWGLTGASLWNIFRILMILCTLILLAFHIVSPKASESGSKPPFTAAYGPDIIFSLFLIVILRSYYGTLLSYSWKKGLSMGIIFSLCIVLGKMTGGILADHIGLRRTTCISLAGAGLLALFSFHSPVLGCLSVLLFNMTMPLTLSLMAGCFPAYPGFSFGFLMLALFLGTLPGMLFDCFALFSPWGLAILCAVSLLLLLYGIQRIGRD